MEKYNLAIIIPALNEAGTIGSVVSSATRYGVPVVIDDGSSDNTSEIARIHGAIVHRHLVNQGYDVALQSGISLANKMGYRYVITLDADGQHNPDLLPLFIHQFALGYDLVLGVRGATQRVGELIFSKFSKMIWGINDPLCGMKGFDLLFVNGDVKPRVYSSIGTDLAIRYILCGANFIQIPLHIKPRFGSSRFGSGCKANYRILVAMLRVVLSYVIYRIK